MKYFLTLIYAFLSLAIIKFQIRHFQISKIIKNTNFFERQLQSINRRRTYRIVNSLYKNKFFFV